MKLVIKRSIILGGTFILAVFGFQNCSDFSLKDEVLYEQGLFDSREALDAQALPSLLNTDTLSLWSKPGNPEFKKKDPFFANQWSVIVAVAREVDGNIITINSNSNVEEATLKVSNGKLRATHMTSVNDYSYIEVSLPSLGESMVYAAAFGNKPTEISLLVNGIVQTAEVKKVGTPLEFSYLSKTVNVGGSRDQVREYVVYGGYDDGFLTKSELNVMSRYVANNNMIANVTYDPSLIEKEPGSDLGGDNTRFLAAKAIIDEKCLGCHNNSNVGDFRNLTESKAVQLGLVVAGDPQNSKLYYRLQNSKGGPLGDGKRDMPVGAAISLSEIQIVADWIAQFK